ncbi:uncharacterized protein LOC128670997 [Plodia interpunctella]|uniref:uncharacterized protein LOC128670997 n=1 Tax=Plodia interpunctella TaxID=58824 RepID=UPI002367C7DF|nr:uncharacterized protein LOC128670997 [Plodia interpunctella]
MEKPARYKAKNKKQAPKPKTPKKRKNDGPTCSMFLSELSRKLAHRKKQEEECNNIVQTIIDSITNALPIKFSRRSSLEKKESPVKIEVLQTFAPELLPNTLLDIPAPEIVKVEEEFTEDTEVPPKEPFKMPKMPLVSSEDIKLAIEKRRRNIQTEDVAINTGTDHDVAAELTKHVGTLRKISLIAEEFNQKTARNLKEIVDSVQEDLIKKLEEINAERQAILAQVPTTSAPVEINKE